MKSNEIQMVQWVMAVDMRRQGERKRAEGTKAKIFDTTFMPGLKKEIEPSFNLRFHLIFNIQGLYWVAKWKKIIYVKRGRNLVILNLGSNRVQKNQSPK